MSIAVWFKYKKSKVKTHQMMKMLVESKTKKDELK